jgi:hypothetical protein
MSAIPTDEPAQDAPPSMDTQQIQQQLQQQQDAQLNPQPVSTEPSRKRSSVLFINVSGLIFVQISESTLGAEGLCRLSHWQNEM